MITRFQKCSKYVAFPECQPFDFSSDAIIQSLLFHQPRIGIRVISVQPVC